MSQVIFGSMRMHEKGRDLEEWVSFFERLHDTGIRLIHCSFEYESFPMLCGTYKEFRERNPSKYFGFIVKVGEPHFGHEYFSANSLEEKVDRYLNALEIDSVERLQWMWRSNDSVAETVSRFNESLDSLKQSFEHLKSSGKCNEVLCFPYSEAFLKAAIDSDRFDGFTLYRNPWETSYADIVKTLPGKSVTVIRPFGAGQGFVNGKSAEYMLRYVFQENAVRDVIATISTNNHLEEVMQYLNDEARI